MDDNIRRCAECSASIEHRTRQAKYCSQACKVAFNREAIRESNRLGKARARARWTPEVKAQKYEQIKAWRAANPDRVKELNRAAYLRDKRKYADARDAWRLANSEKVRQQALGASDRRRALKLGVEARAVTSADRARVLRSNGGLCLYCNHAVADTVDHVIPLVRGGRHAIGNLAPACDYCNKSKGPLLLVEWRRRNALEASLCRRVPDARVVRPGLDYGASRAAGHERVQAA